ncbi:MAG TPA: hypothetical protein VMU41_02470 [Candidatus Binataceae bacterium]|nr:hypothetical protein [Candidatus Binataceae bacterium]
MSRVTRNQVVAMFGTPDHANGSLNSPIELEDKGIHFNEQWTYEHLDADPADVTMRTIYWHRYDFMGTRVRNNADEEWRNDEKLAEALASLNDRLEPITKDHNLPNTPRSYRPVSKPKDVTDLGGYFQKFDDKG